MRPDSPVVAQLARVGGTPAVVTVGTFDGVHAGHRALVAHARGLADARGERLVAVTFSPRPETLVGARPPLPDICSVGERERRLRRAGADAVAVVGFTAAVRAMPAQAFMALLGRLIPMSVLCVGPDFKLGRGGEGTIDALRALGYAVETVELERRPTERQKISSTTIRRTIDAGVPAALALEGLVPVLGDQPCGVTA